MPGKTGRNRERPEGKTKMILDDLMKKPGAWISGEGPESDIVISGRIRLARNLNGFRFIAKMDGEERAACEEEARAQILGAHIVSPDRYIELKKIDPLGRKLLVERHLISREHEDARHPRGVAVGAQEMISIMVNEEDHIRLQVLQSGLRLRETYQIANRVDEQLEEGLDFAFSPELGYLTACPTNVGTGLRVSVMLHLPGLVITRHIEKVFQAVSKLNLAVRGLYGEGTEASGHFYQISNQVTLGRSELDILANVEQVIPAILKYERKARADLMERERRRLEDRVWRAYGLLKAARIMSSDESMMHLSLIRMGIHLGLLNEVSLSTANELFIYSQPAHLQKASGEKLESGERDARRADFIRSKLEPKA